MARQSNTPVAFNRTTRSDNGAVMTSGRAGLCYPVDYIPLLRGDSCSGSFTIDINLAEMPKPLMNGVQLNVQAWFVPKAAHPQFAGYDEFMHSYQEENINALGDTSRTPPPFFNVINNDTNINTIRNSEMFKHLGLHMTPSHWHHSDLIDAFNLIYNFRLAAHSSRLTRRQYVAENLANSVALPPAFWASSRFTNVVPDYERALIVGTLDLDVEAGRLPLEGFFAGSASGGSALPLTTDDPDDWKGTSVGTSPGGNYRDVYVKDEGGGDVRTLFADMVGSTVGVTLADIDKARTTQAFAKLRTAYAGNDATGFDNDDAIVAELMQGFSVPADQFKRPWLLSAKRVPFGFVERHATDAANLDDSVSVGMTSTTLSLNVPRQDTGGVIVITVEVVPERLDERASDEWMYVTSPAQLPDALRDVQRVEPVDPVISRRLDTLHTSPFDVYGYEPMNMQWQRSYTRLGGKFYQSDPTTPFTEARAGLWQTGIIDPEYNETHYLCPADFPHDVFSDTAGDAFELVARHSVAISGLTQMGDVLAENNDDYDAVLTTS
jgi:hypothetical protein